MILYDCSGSICHFRLVKTSCLWPAKIMVCLNAAYLLVVTKTSANLKLCGCTLRKHVLPQPPDVNVLTFYQQMHF